MTADALPGYRRRILIEPGPGAVSAELEDDYHRMVVTLSFADGVITGVESVMKRSPWTTCPGAIAQLEASFLGRPVDQPIGRDEKTQNCTHLADLATFAADHAGEGAAIAYDVEVSDPVDGATVARLWRDGVLLYDLAWTDGVFTAPASMTGLPMKEVGRWVAGEPAETQEAAKILRWAMMISQGRGFAMPAGMSATAFASGAACYNFQPAVAAIGTRRPGADIDFTALGLKPMADREDMFGRA